MQQNWGRYVNCSAKRGLFLCYAAGKHETKVPASSKHMMTQAVWTAVTMHLNSTSIVRGAS
jgi:hypothetical protein